LSEPELTLDEFLRGRLRLWQPRVGYRVSVDSLLLAHFVGAPPFGRVVDLGAGVGVIGLALAERDPSAEVTLAELQPALVALARRNVDENGLGARMHVVEVDLADEAAARAALAGGSFDRVVASPPFFPRAAGPTVPDAGEAIARHELRLTVVGLARAARRLLAPGGRAAVVYPADRLVALLAALDAEGLKPVRLRPIYPRPAAEANRVLVEAVKGSRGGLSLEPPFLVRQSDSTYSEEARAALGEPPVDK
jgi:tRNA1Val (adenine37-N6)-methyltransferase